METYKKAIHITETNGREYFITISIPTDTPDEWQFVCDYIDTQYPNAKFWD